MGTCLLLAAASIQGEAASATNERRDSLTGDIRYERYHNELSRRRDGRLSGKHSEDQETCLGGIGADAIPDDAGSAGCCSMLETHCLSLGETRMVMDCAKTTSTDIHQFTDNLLREIFVQLDANGASGCGAWLRPLI